MKLLGNLLLIAGIIGCLVFGYQAWEDSQSFEFLGLNVAISSAEWTPVIISGCVLLLGMLILRLRK